MKYLSKQFDRHCFAPVPEAKDSAGIALFLAISLLALFSVLGASYMRYMSLELDESDLRIRDMRVRQYAAAGINSAIGQMRAVLLANDAPAESYAFSYPVYGQTQEEDDGLPKSLSTYTAEAKVDVKPIEKEDWENRFVNGTPWPGIGRAFRLVSSAIIQRALPGKIVSVAHQSTEAVLVFEKQDLLLVSMNTMNNYDSPAYLE